MKSELPLPATLIAALLAGVAAAMASTPRADDSLALGDLMSSLSRIETARADFTERKSSAFLVKEVVVEGTLEYRAPDRLTKTVLDPFEERVVIDGDIVRVLKGETQTERVKVSLDSHPALKSMIQSVRATLAGDQSDLESHFEIAIAGTIEAWELRLRPRSAELLEKLEGIRLFGTRNRIARVETDEADGDRSTIELVYLNVVEK